MAECDTVDLNVPDSENATFAANDGERVCCRSGQYHSWSNDQSTCRACPVPTTTAGELFSRSIQLSKQYSHCLKKQI